jgi:O-antigen biosynthesis protein
MTVTGRPAVAVIIPVRDAEAYVAQAIGSVLEQHHLPEASVPEIIVVDDGSTDASREVVQRLIDRCPGRIRLVSASAGNAATARNIGALATEADTLMFLDADDLIAPGTIAALTSALGTVSSGFAVGPWFRLEQADGTWRAAPPSCRPRAPGEDPLAAWLTGWYHPPCSVLWSREAFERAGRWEEGLAMNDDGDLAMRALAIDTPLAVSRAGASYYRRAPQGASSLSDQRASAAGLEARLGVVEKIAWWLEDSGGMSRARRSALRSAATRIAQDARAGSPGLIERADRVARPSAPRVLRPLGRRWDIATSSLRERRSRRPAPGEHRPLDVVPSTITWGSATARLARPLSPDDAGTPTGEAIVRPAVSVVIPTYQRAHSVVRAIDSVLAQSFRDFEVLVVDDGSTDDTEARVAALDDPRVRCVRKPYNEGVAAARNLGIRESRGRYLAFLDSDDVWFPDKLARQLERFDHAPDRLGLVYGGVEQHDGQGNTETSRPSHRGRLYAELLERNVIHGGGSNVMIPRHVVARAGFFDESLPAIEDYDYWLRISRGHDIDFVDAVIMRYENPVGAERKSLHMASNHEARRRFHRKHRRQMRSAGVEHRFLADSARRLVAGDRDDRRAARRVALRSWWAAPWSPTGYRIVARTWLPRLRRMLRHGPDVRQPTASRPQRRVLLYSPTPENEPGGVQAATRALTTGLRERGHHVTQRWSETADGPALRLDLPEVAANPTTVASSLIASTRSFTRLAREMARMRPDIVHVHYIGAEVLHFLALRPIFRYRLILSAHGSDVMAPTGRRTQRWARRAVARADAVTAVSEPLRGRLADYPDMTDELVHLVPNGIDWKFWSAGDRATASRPIIVSVGRLTDVKGHDVLIESMQQIIEQVPDALLLIIGDGERRDELESMSRRMLPAGSVAITGPLDPDAIRDLLATATVFVLPSRSEGMPLALLEAMAAGLPSVASDVGAVAHLLVGADTHESGSHGRTVPVEDTDALATAVVDLLLDADTAQQMGRHASARARQFDMATMVDRYDSLYTQVGEVDEQERSR